MEANGMPVVRAARKVIDRRVELAAALIAAGVALQLVGLLVIGRRLAGAVDRPAPATIVMAAAALAALFSWLGRRIWRSRIVPRGDATGRPILDTVVGWSPSLALVLLAFGLSLPFARSVDWLVWAPICVADAYWCRWFFAREPMDDADAAVPAAQRATFDPVPIDEPVLLQRLMRHRDAAGRESIAASLCAEIAAGQRTAELYVGFCPPFAGTPTIDVEQSDGPPARVVAGQLFPHGARIDVRLHEPAAMAGRVGVDVFASG